MKKRSLVSAIAMLVVSALILTTATFAWFSSASTATTQNINASIDEGSGLYIATSNGTDADWKNYLTKAELDAATGNIVAGNDKLNPVSLSNEEGTISIVGGSLAAETGSTNLAYNLASAGSCYYRYTIYVKYDIAGDIEVTVPTWVRGSNFTYIMLAENGDATNYAVIGAAGDKYTPVLSGDKALDENKNYIVDADEVDNIDGSSITLGTEITAVAATSGKLTIDGGNTAGVKAVDVYIWAEGQDSNCMPGTTVDATGLIASLQFDLVTD